jgi:glycosyltransferase involved in cell wall biosynthesis
MLRVLHLMSASPDLETAHGAQMLRRGLGDAITISTHSIGRGGDSRNLPLAAAALRGRSRQFDLIHVWDLTALLAAAFGSTSPLVFSPSRLPSRTQTGWIRAAMRRREVRIVVSSESTRTVLVRRGIRPDRCQVLRPAVDPTAIPQRDDHARERLGILADDFVLLAPGESIRPAGHRVAVWTASILHVLDTRFRLLLWGRGEEAQAAQTLARKLGQPRLVIPAEKQLGGRIEFEHLPAAADVALITASPAAPLLPAALCMAAGLPIVAADSPPLCELLSDGHNASISSELRPRLLVKRVLELRSNAPEMRRLGAAAQSSAARHFEPAAFIDAYRRLYALAARTPTAPSNVVTGQSLPCPGT